MIPYFYYFEFGDQSWFPNFLRKPYFQALTFVQNSVGLKRLLQKDLPAHLKLWMKNHELTHLIELGSGSGNDLAKLAEFAPSPLTLIATDKFPQTDLWKTQFHDLKNIQFINEPVSFEDFETHLKTELQKPSLLFLNSVLHHLDPSFLETFLKRAKKAHVSILAVEPLSRNWLGVFLGFGAGLLSLLAPFNPQLNFIDRLKLILFIWIIPVLPILVAHDGIASALRQRTETEWQTIAKKLGFKVVFSKKTGFFRNFRLFSFTPSL